LAQKLHAGIFIPHTVKAIMSLLKSAITAAFLAAAAHAGATVIDFNGTSNGGYATVGNSVWAGALSLSSAGSMYSIGNGYVGNDANVYAYNDTDYLLTYAPYTFTSIGAATFSVQSLDLVAWNATLTSAILTGNFAGGGSIVYTVTLDPVANEVKQTGNDFIKYALSGFTGLTSLTIQGNGPSWLAMDNLDIEVTAVPEPGSLAVFGLGLAGLAAMRRHKQK
jgi:hypothetical protein